MQTRFSLQMGVSLSRTGISSITTLSVLLTTLHDAQRRLNLHGVQTACNSVCYLFVLVQFVQLFCGV
jgi:hypothetical protein